MAISSYKKALIFHCALVKGQENITAHRVVTQNLYNYARDNLAIVNIYIKQPVVTKILRDQRIPIIWFVANCGGILGKQKHH